MSDVGELSIVCKLPSKRPAARADGESSEKLFINVEIQAVGASMHVIFTELESRRAPYRIENRSPYPVVVSQSPCEALQHPRVVAEVLPSRSAPFAWEQIVEEPTLAIFVANIRRSVCVDDLQLSGFIALEPKAVGAPRREALHYRLAADGPVKVLELLPPPQHGEASAMAPLSPGWAAEAEPRALDLKVHVRLNAVALSLVDDQRVAQHFGAPAAAPPPRVSSSDSAAGISACDDDEPRELIYTSLLDIRVGYEMCTAGSTLSVRVGRMQVFFCFFLSLKPISPICQSPLFPYLTSQFVL